MSVLNFKAISLIASHDSSGIRTKMYSVLSSVARLSYPGLFMKNCYGIKRYFDIMRLPIFSNLSYIYALRILPAINM